MNTNPGVAVAVNIAASPFLLPALELRWKIYKELLYHDPVNNTDVFPLSSGFSDCELTTEEQQRADEELICKIMDDTEPWGERKNW